MPVPDRTHNDLWDRIGLLESNMSAMTERLDATRTIVLSNQDEFRSRIAHIESSVAENTILITKVDQKITTGTKVLTWMFSAGIAAMGIGLSVIAYLTGG